MARPTRGYKLADGSKAEGVTTILNTIGFGKDALVGWANKIGREGLKSHEVSRHAARVGTCAHDRIEALLTGKPFDDSGFTPEEMAEADPCVEMFRVWRTGKRIKVVSIELAMTSETYRCGGTLDLVARINNGPLTLIDFKTSGNLYETYIAQVAGYLDMLADIHDKHINTAILVRFGKDGTCDELVIEGEMLERGRRLFHIARELKAMEPLLKSDLATATRIVGEVPHVVDLPTITKEAKIA